MADFPILFKPEMIRAILDGRKTQTRRVVKPQPTGMYRRDYTVYSDGIAPSFGLHPELATDREIRVCCPYGVPGDRLWVREKHALMATENGWMVRAAVDSSEWMSECCVSAWQDPIDEWSKWRPSIHMPRWASRITLEVTEVRVDRVQDITTEDIIAEGLSTTMREYDAECHLREQWIELWDSINAKPRAVKGDGVVSHYESFPWEDTQETREHRGKPHYVFGNPWVWKLTFDKEGAAA